MKIFFKATELMRKNIFFLLLPLLVLFLPSIAGCTQEIVYFDFVSELRSNLFLARTEEFSLRIYSVFKESPYAADGVAQPTAPRFEAYLVAPSGDKRAELYFTVEKKTCGGEMSYDGVKGEYYYGCTLDVSALTAIDCVVTYGEEEIKLTAASVLTKDTLSPKAALNKLYAACSEPFLALTDKYGFAGEIYLRLIYEDFPYYYVGVIDREGNIQAFLLNAETGAILARRQK